MSSANQPITSTMRSRTLATSVGSAPEMPLACPVRTFDWAQSRGWRTGIRYRRRGSFSRSRMMRSASERISSVTSPDSFQTRTRTRSLMTWSP